MGNNSEIERVITKSDVHLEGMEVFGLGHKLDKIMKALYVYYGEQI